MFFFCRCWIFDMPSSLFYRFFLILCWIITTIPSSCTQAFPWIGKVYFLVPDGVVIISKISGTWTSLMRNRITEKNYELFIIMKGSWTCIKYNLIKLYVRKTNVLTWLLQVHSWSDVSTMQKHKHKMRVFYQHKCQSKIFHNHYCAEKYGVL